MSPRLSRNGARQPTNTKRRLSMLTLPTTQPLPTRRRVPPPLHARDGAARRPPRRPPHRPRRRRRRPPRRPQGSHETPRRIRRRARLARAPHRPGRGSRRRRPGRGLRHHGRHRRVLRGLIRRRRPSAPSGSSSRSRATGYACWQASPYLSVDRRSKFDKPPCAAAVPWTPTDEE